ncbi:acyl-CoA thioesterase [candidate division KSB1 bacterium]|nr:acyl-CoA thioesterase [candidate division KSB1 bacterium]
MNSQSIPIDFAAQAEMTELVLPQHTNTHGYLLGGSLVHWMDMVAALAAKRHCKQPVLTVSIDHIRFLRPATVGEYIILKASLNRAFDSSMEIGVRCAAVEPYSGEERHICSGYFTFVALDAVGKPAKVPAYSPQTESERRRWQEAGSRRERVKTR